MKTESKSYLEIATGWLVSVANHDLFVIHLIVINFGFAGLALTTEYTLGFGAPFDALAHGGTAAFVALAVILNRSADP